METELLERLLGARSIRIAVTGLHGVRGRQPTRGCYTHAPEHGHRGTTGGRSCGSVNGTRWKGR